ncbi:hypothetical protein BC936DRAFT_148058 [Jimgerdemannia flammicorona]|uniref:Uncharacterized protein n=1 Tax=Jimgerdemannia flammicorona TaxID=994334 RepID=A0A433D3W7_9FUNG|nr:hypothetical protein BC936DRAFT_148058 [Jimgerdemannia flammicorona]
METNIFSNVTETIGAWYSPDRSKWEPPYIQVGCEIQHVTRDKKVNSTRAPYCAEVLDGNVDLEGSMMSYNYYLLSPLFFSDYITCNELPDPLPIYCTGFSVFTIDFSPPPNVTMQPYTTLRLLVDNQHPRYETDKIYYPKKTDSLPGYAVLPGEILDITIDYVLNVDVTGHTYYTNTQTYITRPSEFNDSRTFVMFSARTDYYMVNQEHYIHSWGELFGLIGGLYGGAASAFIILFGAARLSPWGIFQKNVFKSVLSGPLNDGFNPPNSIVKSGTPLADPIPISPEADPAEDVIILRARLEKLEGFLSNYVIDRGLLDSIVQGKVAKKHEHEMETGSIADKGF